MKNIPEEFAPQSRRSVPPPGGGSFAPGIRLDYEALVARLLRNWYWFVLAVALFVGLAWLQLRYTVPLYQSSASIVIQEQSGGQGGISKDAIAQELGFNASYSIENEVHMLRSDGLMEDVVNRLGLDVSYIHQGRVRDTEIYQPENFVLVPTDTIPEGMDVPVRYGSVMVRLDNPSSFSLIRGEADTIAMRYGESFPIGNQQFMLLFTGSGEGLGPESIYEIKVKDPIHTAMDYAGRLNVGQVERSGVVNMNIVDPVPKKARDVLNGVIAAYSDMIVEDQRRTGGQTVAFIEERLDFVTDELYEVEASVASFKQRAGLSVDLATQGSNYLEQMNAADEQLAELQVRRELIEDIRNTLTQSDDYEQLPIASEIISGVLSELIVQYNTAIFERDQKMESLTPNHPLMATTNETLDNLKTSILRSINSVLRETNERVAKIEERIEPIEAGISRLPANEQRLLQIMRQQTIKQNLFMFLLEKREEAAVTVAAQVPNTRVIDAARVPTYPISPNKPMIYLLAIGLGLIVPGSAIFLREMLGSTIGTEKEILNQLPYPVIGRITNGPKADDGLVVTKSNRSAVGEAFRLLRTNIGFLLPGDQSAVLMVTSSVSGEGKSYISSNLGASLALTNKRVVVVGLDMRKPMLAEMINGKEKAKTSDGLSSYLIGKSSYEDVLQSTENEYLSIVPSGPLPPNPAELLLEGRMAALLHRLRQEFDIVILDSPPVGIVTDGLLMKDYVNVTLFVTRLNTTPKKSINYINELVDTGKLPRFNLVVNGIPPKDAYGYGYGYYS